MPEKNNVLCIGNAIVDILAQADDDFLVKENIIKGAMNLIDAERAAHLYSIMGPAIETSGGSASNTASGIASFGGKAAYIGKVAKDHLGEVFSHDIRAAGVSFETAPIESGQPPTATSIIFITPDGERSMNTFLSACVELGIEDIDEETVSQSKITYFEGYLWDPPRAKEAILKASTLAHKANNKMAMSLSDSFCVDRYRDEFLDLMRSGKVDYIQANESELHSLYQTSSTDEGIKQLANDCELASVTRSEQGSIIVSGEKIIEVDAKPIDKLVDTTGAGDLYAAGFLFGLANDYTLEEAGALASLAASEVIQHIGPRPQKPLKDLLAGAIL